MQAPEDLTKERLISDLVKLRQRIDKLEKIEEEKKKYEAELSQIKAMFEGLFEFAPDAILIIGSQALIVQANKQAERLFGYAREELIGKDSNLLVPERFREKHRENQKTYMSNPHIRQMGTGLELYGRKKDGSEVPVDIALGPMQLEDDIVTLAVVRDFTERKRAMEELRISEERLRYASIAADIGAWQWDLMKNELIWDDKCKELFGYPPDYPMTYQAFLQPIHEEDRKRIDEAVSLVLKDKRDYFVEMRVLLPDGQMRWVMSKGRGFYDEQGKPVRMHGIAADITARKREEEAVLDGQTHAREQSAELKAVIDALPAGVLIAQDPECSRITCNPTWLEIIGATEGQNIFKDASCEPPQCEIRRGGVPISIDQLPIRVACSSGQPVVGDTLEIIRADGVIRHFYGNAVPLLDSHGAARGAVSVLLDITELRQAYDRIANLAAIVESSADAIIGKTLEGVIVSWNHGAEALYGYSDREAIGRSISLLVPPDHPFELPTLLERIRRGEVIAAHDTQRMRKDGTLVDVSLMVSPVKDSTGKIIGASTIARDITERKEYEERIKQYSDELERSNRELNHFASIVSHDLRAPLRAVSGFTGMLQKRYKQKLGADADQYISNIVEGTERMSHLIDDLIEYSRVAIRENALAPVNVNTIVEKTLANLRFEVQERGAVITVDPLPTVYANSTQLIQLFQNLVGNAIKYCNTTPRIQISAEPKDGWWLFQVRDNGIGIDPGQFDRIFQIFQRLHDIDEYSGTGIGLAVCKKVVESLGGRIWVESKPGEGSTFFFTLPAIQS